MAWDTRTIQATSGLNPLPVNSYGVAFCSGDLATYRCPCGPRSLSGSVPGLTPREE